jgi:hypothetical protein
VSLRMLAHLRLSTAQQRTAGQDLPSDLSVSRDRKIARIARVEEARWNACTVALRVVRGDGKGTQCQGV